MNYIHRLFAGRLNKKNYFYSIFFLAFFFLLLFSLEIFIPLLLRLDEIPPLFAYPFGYGSLVIIMFFAFSLYVRRLHDCGRSGWWSLLYFVPYVNALVGILLLFYEGDEKENKYGKPQYPDGFDLASIFLPKQAKKEQTMQKPEELSSETSSD
jgi:uncharacterized membrane protein YhaH (DUF805 family)